MERRAEASCSGLSPRGGGDPQDRWQLAVGCVRESIARSSGRSTWLYLQLLHDGHITRVFQGHTTFPFLVDETPSWVHYLLISGAFVPDGLVPGRAAYPPTTKRTL